MEKNWGDTPSATLKIEIIIRKGVYVATGPSCEYICNKYVIDIHLLNK